MTPPPRRYHPRGRVARPEVAGVSATEVGTELKTALIAESAALKMPLGRYLTLILAGLDKKQRMRAAMGPR